MDTKLILQFLRDVMANNNRPWFQQHKDVYLAAKEDFERGVAAAISRISTFDSSVAHIGVKDATYRFYRDTRFSPDKSPYKNHLGAYISARSYWLPTNILTSCRNEIMANEEEWLKCVESKEFIKYFGDSFEPCTERDSWGTKQGFGLEKLKTCPAGFPRDYAQVKYLRLKNYCCWHRVSNDFFEGDAWLKQMEIVFKAAKPMMDFMNSVIDDYE